MYFRQMSRPRSAKRVDVGARTSRDAILNGLVGAYLIAIHAHATQTGAVRST